jgi:ligand-binding sensor domain-containing protein/two-component sensor histidine kinase
MKKIFQATVVHNSYQIRLAIILLILIMQTAVQSQDEEPRFIRLPLDKGVALDLTYAMIQDHEGYLWFGTMYGLVRYDGRDYKTFNYNPKNSESISFDDIVSLYEDSKGNLWIGTWGGGLNMLNPQRTKFTRFVYDRSNPDGISDNIVWAITEDNKGNIWLGTETGGINKYDPTQNKFTSYNLVKSDGVQRAAKIWYLITDMDGNVWAASSLGLSKYSLSSNDFVTYQIPDDNNTSKRIFISCINEESQNNLLLGTSNGLYYFNKNSNEFNIEESLPQINIKSIATDHNKMIWLGTTNGLVKFNSLNSGYENYNRTENPNSLSGNFIKTVFEDNSGVLWINMYQSGISKLINRKPNFALLQNKQGNNNSLSSSFITSLAEDKNGNIWIGTSSGLNKYIPASNKIERINDRLLKDQNITSVTVDSNNIILVSLRDRIYKYNQDKKRLSEVINQTQSKEFANKSINSLMTDSNGTLWIGTYSSGIYIFKDNKLEHIALETEGAHSNATNYILSFHEDIEGNIWIGTFGGLYLFNIADSSFTSFVQELNNSSSLSNNYVYSIQEASNGEMWIGTARGLNIFNPKTNSFRALFEKDGLPNDVICGIVKDENKGLWLSTYKGISHFNPMENTYKNFDKDDGLQSNLFRQGVYLKGRDGKVYFGGKDGLNLFDPEDVQINEYNSPVVISSFNIITEYGRKENILLNNKVIGLNPYENNLEFKVVSFDYSMPAKTTFKYQLSGYDHDWINLGTTNTFKIQNLSPGDYTLLVRGTNGDGVWSSNEAAVLFIIHPPFWQTVWFYLSILFVIVSVSFIIHKLIVRSKVNRAVEIEKIKEKEGERIRRKTAIDFHDELGHRLTRISLLTELIKRKFGNTFSDISSLLDQIGDNSSQLYDGTKDFIWAIDPQQDSLYELIIRLKDFGDELYSNTNIDFEVTGLNKKFQSTQLSMEWKRHLMLIFKEGMNNSLKHSNGNSVSFATHTDGDDLEITLEDNGNGFPQNTESKGNGIKNMIGRAEKLDSYLLIDTEPGKGTKILFKGKFPIKSLNFN